MDRVLKNIIRFVCLLYITVMVWATDYAWSHALLSCCHGTVKILNEVIASRATANIASTLMVICLFCLVLYNLSRTRTFNWSVALFCTIAFAECCISDVWHFYATCFPMINYGQLIGYCSIFVLISMLVLPYVTSLNKSNSLNHHNGFSIDTAENELVNVGWSQYCNTLAFKLNHTDLSKECFSIGICGRWGSGKTTFLKKLRSAVQNDFTVIEFNPWTNSDAKKLVANFFSTLDANMPSVEQTLKQYLREYADLLTSVASSEKILNFLINHSDNHSKSIVALKNKINDLAVLGQKYAVFIDDLDRLNTEEVFEVLRIIRMTANFPNFCFIAAYDKQHVVSMLDVNGIRNGAEYIKKIFQVEIVLPDYEADRLPQVLYNELRDLNGDTKSLNWLHHTIFFTTDNEYVIARYLPKFRDIKRFANLFKLNYEYLQNYIGSTEFNIIDLWWLEILHYFDEEVYSLLREQPTLFLEIRKENSDVKCYKIRQEYKQSGVEFGAIVKDENLTKTLGVNIQKVSKCKISDDTAFLLFLIFGRSDTSHNSVRYVDNFERYFAYRILDHKVTESEIRNFLDICSTDIEIVESEFKARKWSNCLNSLISQAKLFTLSEITISWKKAFLKLLVCMAQDNDREDLVNLMAHKTSIDNYTVEEQSEISDVFCQLCLSTIPKSKHAFMWIEFLVAEYPCVTYDMSSGTEEQSPNCILNVSQIKKLANVTFDLFVKSYSSFNVYDILNEGKVINQFMVQSKVHVWKDIENEQIEDECLIIDSLIQFLSVHSQENSFERFVKQFAIHDAEIGIADQIMQDNRSKILKTFASFKNYKTFVDKCFNINDDTKQKHFKFIGI